MDHPAPLEGRDDRDGNRDRPEPLTEPSGGVFTHPSQLLYFIQNRRSWEGSDCRSMEKLEWEAGMECESFRKSIYQNVPFSPPGGSRSGAGAFDHFEADVEHLLGIEPAVHPGEHGLGGEAADGSPVDPDGRERREGVGGEIEVAEAHDGHVARNGHAARLNLSQ